MIELTPSSTVVLTLFNWEVHWYGVLYVVAFGVALWLLPHAQHWRNLSLTRQQWFEIVTYAAVGVLVGGRLGYVLLYEPGYFIQHLGEVVLLSSGGMSLHGGMLGVAGALWFMAKRHKVSLLALADVSAPIASLGIALGRVGNVINQELFTPPLGPWLAPLGPLFIAVISFFVLKTKSRPGSAAVVFLLASAVWRFVIEFLREQPDAYNVVSRGQFLSLLLALGGVLLWMHVRAHQPRSHEN